ncbi:cyclin-like protein interacting with PHO85 [Rhizina undulata]
MQVGLRPDNIMIAGNTQPDASTFHRPSLSHASTSSSVQSAPEQWSSTIPRPSSSAAPTPIQPATSARGAPPSVFRHPSSASSTQPFAASVPSHPSSTHKNFEQQPAVLPPPIGASFGTASASSSASSSLAGPDPRTLSPSRPKRSLEDTPPVNLRNLSHVVELAKDDLAHSLSPPRRNRSGYEDRRRYDISGMPVTDVIEMVAGLLTKITTTNDRQHGQLHRTIPPPESGMSNTTSSVLAFHGKNVPSITILSYLSRIHKYCPTTYEVFLSLLVYFDRMTERVNKSPLQDYKPPRLVGGGEQEPAPAASAIPADPYNISHFFVVDSFNIHRLVIAGVTCASKFFSDVFYTNSRYAKVGGLPLAELNHLELQFLILNDFRLSVPAEELESYGTMLVQFYAREAVANANLQLNHIQPPPPVQRVDTGSATSSTAAAAASS